MKVLHSICQQNWKTQQWSQDWKRSVFIPIPKKGKAKEDSDYHTIALISHVSKATLKFSKPGFNSCELPDSQAGFRKRTKTTCSSDSQRNQRSNSQHLLDHQKRKRIPEKKKSISAFLTTPKPLSVRITTNCGKF